MTAALETAENGDQEVAGGALAGDELEAGGFPNGFSGGQEVSGGGLGTLGGDSGAGSGAGMGVGLGGDLSGSSGGEHGIGGVRGRGAAGSLSSLTNLLGEIDAEGEAEFEAGLVMGFTQQA